MFILILCIGLAFFFVVKSFVQSKRSSRQVVQLYSGTVGAGKTYIAVNARAISSFKTLKRWYKHRNNFFRRYITHHTCDRPPRLYSNIPIYIGKKDGWSFVLKREHLLLMQPFDPNYTTIVVWDEVGMAANQYSYDDPNIVSENLIDRVACVETFIRLFRHFCGEGNADRCRLLCTDQASGDVCIALRRRFGVIDYLSDFHRWLGITPFYKVFVREMLIAEDQVTNVNDTVKQDDQHVDFYFGFLPYRRRKNTHYDSHCFSGLQVTGATVRGRLPFENWSDNDYTYCLGGKLVVSPFKTDYIPDLRMTYQEKKEYKDRIRGLIREA